MRNTKIESRLRTVLAPNSGRRGVTSTQALAATVFSAFAIPAVATVSTSLVPQTPPSPERAEAQSRIKQLSLGTLMYANDYDGVFPYVQQTATLKGIVYPYTKNPQIYESPTAGGRFLFDMHLAGVELAEVGVDLASATPPTRAPGIPDPATVPMWVEKLPDASLPFAVAFANGRTTLSTDHAKIDRELKATFPRKPTSKPLPKNYMISPAH